MSTRLLDCLGVELDSAWMALDSDFREHIDNGRPIDLKASEHLPAEEDAA
ncbi:MAG: hypothetical protein QNI99_20520 [Woeseiaceae bacterium]|nr:hypothetical protein [Woeseiaceae bacterium]